MGKYYIMGINRFNETASKLNVCSEGTLKNEFLDIADIDLATTDIEPLNFRKKIKEINKNFDLNQESVFIAQYPYRKIDSKLYYILQSGINENTKKYIDGLRFFSKQRSELVSLGEGKKLEYTDEFDEYTDKIINGIVRDICTSNGDILLAKETLILKYIKDKLMVLKYCKNFSTDFEYAKIKSGLRDYKALRNLVLEYVLYLEKKDVLLRNNLMTVSKEVSNGSFISKDYITNSITNPDEFHQMTLDEYGLILKQ